MLPIFVFLIKCLTLIKTDLIKLLKFLANYNCQSPYCQNSGNCQQDGPDIICICRHGFGGDRCKEGKT